MNIKEKCQHLRKKLLAMEEEIRHLVSDTSSDAEMHAHSNLALRALEDVRMRLGKVIQYHDDGVSIYDKPPYVSASIPMPVGGEVHPVETTPAGHVAVPGSKIDELEKLINSESDEPVKILPDGRVVAAKDYPGPADPDDVVDAPHPADEAAAGEADQQAENPVMRSANPIPRDGFTYGEDKEADTNQ